MAINRQLGRGRERVREAAVCAPARPSAAILCPPAQAVAVWKGFSREEGRHYRILTNKKRELNDYRL
ncbi:hypothetical protein scyTo_0010427 [Scyliorhinus torazame]|uniref:Uncharacterized protein n=1 Tax=Scyliorhinus torazame TaxID=75743 RepID=A0A401P678_SCYTO|nr:hypothetical protein [Scyliorhinus torazame]